MRITCSLLCIRLRTDAQRLKPKLRIVVIKELIV